MADLVDFYKLSRVVQDRFVSSAGSAFAPLPIAFRHGGPITGSAWLGASAAAAVALVGVAVAGTGDLTSSAAIHGAGYLVVYGALYFTIAFGILSSLAHTRREKKLPYRVGIYVFPLCVIDARTRRMRVHPIGDVSSAEQHGDILRLTIGGRTLELPASPGADAKILEAKAAAPKALERKDPNELIELDPLFNPRFSSPVAPIGPYREVMPSWARYPWAIPFAVAVVLGSITWAGRNAVSDNRMYVGALRKNDVASYQAYLARARGHAEEVRGTLLPRAELRIAIDLGTPDALLAYQVAHPGSRIQGEIDVAMRAAMLRALERAKEKQTKAALDEFARAYPNHGVAPELAAAVHAVYARALAAYKAKAPPPKEGEPSIVPTMERVFSFAEKGAGKVEIRFRRRSLRSLRQADEFIMKTPTYTGEIAHPSRYFDGPHQARREEALAKDLAAKLEAAIAPEILRFSQGDELTDEKARLTVPTLVITHGPDWSTHAYESKNPAGTYAGLNFMYEVELAVPDEAEPFKWTPPIVFRHAALYVLKENEQGNEDKVYEEMSKNATSIFEAKLLGLFLATPPAP